MFPLDSETGKPWSASSIKMLTERFSAEADAELRARDTKLSGGVLCEANGYKCYVPDSNGRYVVDQSLSRIRHTGRERRLLRNKKMAEFCLEPKSEAEFIKTHVLGDKRIQGLQRWINTPEQATSVASVVDFERTDYPTDRTEPIKRRPGRPRKEAFAST